MNLEIKNIVDQCLNGDSLIELLEHSSIGKDEAYRKLAEEIFKRNIHKADLFFAYGPIAVEMEDAIETKCTLDTLPFDEQDLIFYEACRQCYSDFQQAIVLIERILWLGTDIVMRHHYGGGWIAEVDRMKRRGWAQMREDYRTGIEEPPLFQFSSIPDLKDIIIASNNWSIFSKHLPKKYADKTIFKNIITTFLVPLRNKIFHPTRDQILNYTEWVQLKEMLSSIHFINWRPKESELFSDINVELPRARLY